MTSFVGSLIPWRNPIRGPLLVNTLFRLAVVKKIYLKLPGEKLKADERWRVFTEELFQQPEFQGIEGSFRAVKDQFNMVLKERARFHGWLDANGGLTGNLSAKDGHQLDELDQNVKIILMDQEQRKAEKNLSNVLNNIDSGIINDSLSSDSSSLRGKRKQSHLLLPGRNCPSSGSSVSTSNSSKRASFDDVLIEYLHDNHDNKKSRIMTENDIEEKLLDFFKTKSIQSILNECDALNEKNVKLVEQIGIKILINVYCCEGKDCNVDYFKNELVSFGMERLVAHKLHYYLTETYKSITNSSIQATPISAAVERAVTLESPAGQIDFISENNYFYYNF